jgi:hypothetical protein
MKKKFSIILLLFVIIASNSCKRAAPCCYIPDQIRVNVHYLDTSGNTLFMNDLLGYKKSNVRTYALVDNLKVLDANVDIVTSTATYNPYRWEYVYDEDRGDSVYAAIFSLPFTKNDYKRVHYFTLLIDLKEGVEDTMQTYITSEGIVDSLWYNARLRYSNTHSPESSLTDKIINVTKVN